MKPKRIILIRHGESEGNADKHQLAVKPDYTHGLTVKGVGQANAAGKRIHEIVGNETIHAYVSPWHRTRQTFAEIRAALNVVKAFEDPRIREQDWGHLREAAANKVIQKERLAYGVFYFRIPDGESGADVYDRVSSFLETLHRDFAKDDYAENTLIVTHGLAMRIFLMRWFHWSVEEFEALKNPANCELAIMEQQEGGRYALVTEVRKR